MAWKARRTQADDVPFRVKGKVGRIEDPPHAGFFKRYVEANRPVLISGVMEPWPALERWSPSYLAEVAGDQAAAMDLASDPRALQELMSSHAVERLLRDPAMLESMARLMAGRAN